MLTRLDKDVIARLMQILQTENRGLATDEDFLNAQDPSWRDMTRNRERDECRAKLVALGILRETETGL
ncbi:MAG: hypothetical protein QM811_30635 [Pirellulales bacterium]